MPEQWSRRAVLLLTAGALPFLCAAGEPIPPSYGGFALDFSALPGEPQKRLVDSLHAQIDLVDSVRMRADILAFFQEQRLILDPTLNQPGRAGPRGLFLQPEIQPKENPVLLHELLHVYHARRLPDGMRNADVLRFYEEAKGKRDYPANSYMLSNVVEFFAMTVSVVLWGRAARPPSTRSTVRRVQSEYYDWIVREFALQA